MDITTRSLPALYPSHGPGPYRDGAILTSPPGTPGTPLTLLTPPHPPSRPFIFLPASGGGGQPIRAADPNAAANSPHFISSFIPAHVLMV
ncbi:hypothetical protein LY78DRAFT_662734, partial [Colletotrichum sublineola]